MNSSHDDTVSYKTSRKIYGPTPARIKQNIKQIPGQLRMIYKFKLAVESIKSDVTHTVIR